MSHFVTYIIAPPSVQMENAYDYARGVMRKYKEYGCGAEVEAPESQLKFSVQPEGEDEIVFDSAEAAADAGYTAGEHGTYGEGDYYTAGWYNPEAKWDWFLVGGRYTGRLRACEGADALKSGGAYSHTLHRVKGGPCDVARAGDIDWYHAYNEAARDIEEIAHAAESVLNADRGAFRPFSRVLAGTSSSAKASDSTRHERARDAFSAQPAVLHFDEAVAAVLGDGDIGYMMGQMYHRLLDEVYESGAESVVHRRKMRAVLPFAIVHTDGTWSARERMGTRAVATEGDEEWSNDAWKLLTELPARTLIISLDCHI